MSTLVDQHALGKLTWRCRRGMLENDLLIERFFQRHEASLPTRQADALTRLVSTTRGPV